MQIARLDNSSLSRGEELRETCDAAYVQRGRRCHGSNWWRDSRWGRAVNEREREKRRTASETYVPSLELGRCCPLQGLEALLLAKHCIVLRSCRVFVPIGKTSGRRARCQTGTSTRSHDRVEILGRRIERSTLVGDIMIARFSLYDFIAVVM